MSDSQKDKEQRFCRSLEARLLRRAAQKFSMPQHRKLFMQRARELEHELDGLAPVRDA
jgi:hypothetical protein